MTPLAAARAVAAGRVAVGAALLLAPGLAGRAWIGDDAQRPAVHAIVRALGIRDLILGALTLHVANRPGVGARTVATCALVDAVDFGATLAAREHIPTSAATGTMAVAGGAALAGGALAALLRE